ncbi:MAG: transposase [Anaerolineales bacterium]|jgi:hypothetical protein
MELPSKNDYVETYFTLFEQYQQGRHQKAGRGRPYTYEDQILIVSFTLMMIRRITTFKAQRRWLSRHPREGKQLGLASLPHRTTLSRRYKHMYETIQMFTFFVGWWAEMLSPVFRNRMLAEDVSLFKALGPVWHQSDRQVNRIPDKLRNLDTEASWGKSGYHGWVYGYGLHLTCNQAGFPKLVQVETTSLDESHILEQKTERIFHLVPRALVADNAYPQAMRVRQWAKAGVLLLTPASSWKKGRYAQAYQRLIRKRPFRQWLASRKTAIEPVFDLFAKVLGTIHHQKNYLFEAWLMCVPF